MASRLTIVEVQTLRVGEQMADPDHPGLRFRRSARGTLTAFYRYRTPAGSQREYKLGDLGPGLTLKGAREAWHKAKVQRDQGVDLQAEKQAARDAARAVQAAAKAKAKALTLEKLVARYAAKRLCELVSGTEGERLLRREVLPMLGSRPALDITRAEVRDLLAAVRERAPRVAGQTLGHLRAMYRWAVEEGLVPEDHLLPTEGLRSPRRLSRDRALSVGELRQVLTWWADPRCALAAVIIDALRLVLLTGCRPGEICGARWEHIDLDAGELRLPTTKTGTSTVVLLSRQAVALLRGRVGLDATFVFPSRRRDGRIGALAERALPRALWVVRRAKDDDQPGDPLAAGWTPHDLRRSCATGLARAGASREIVRRVLNHTDRSVDGVYDRHGYADEARAALQRWADHLDALQAGNLVQLSECRGGVA